MTEQIVRLGPEYFPRPTSGIPVSGASIFIGLPDTDPEILANQIQVSALQENGATVPIPQPILTGGGGIPLYNGSPVTLSVDQSYSLKVLDSFSVQVYYVPKNIKEGDVEAFENVADMIAAVLIVGDLYQTKGYYVAGDGGGGEYLVVLGDSSDPNINLIVNGGTDTAVLQYGEFINIKQAGAVGDGATDDTVSIQGALDIVKFIKAGVGTFIIDQINLVSDSTIKGAGMGNTIFKKLATSVNVQTVLGSSISNLLMEDLTVDGNTLSAIAATNIYFTGCNNIDLNRVDSANAKTVASAWGGGITFIDGTDLVDNTTSSFRNGKVRNNGSYGLQILKSSSVDIVGNETYNNPNAGIAVDNFELPVPVAPTQTRIGIRDNQCYGNGIGISMFGFRSGVSALGDLWSFTDPVTSDVTITDNLLYNNDEYGLTVQARGVTATGNIIKENGNSISNGGAMFTCLNSVFSNNILSGNFYFGLDAGGAYRTKITDNQIYSTGNSINRCVALNAGGCIGTNISDNIFFNNGGDGSGGDPITILASALDGSGNDNFFPWTGNTLKINANDIALSNANDIGIKVINGFKAVQINDNFIDNSVGATPFFLPVDKNLIDVNDNKVIDSTFSYNTVVASASTVVIPEYNDVIEISGSTNISLVKSFNQNYFEDKVSFAFMTNIGSGYTTAPSVVFSGGGGTGADGIAAISADGKIYGIYITNHGTGYTSVPTIAITGGGGTGAVATSVVGNTGVNNRIVTLKITGSLSVFSGPGLFLDGGTFVSSVSGISSLTLRRDGANWMEVSRSN